MKRLPVCTFCGSLTQNKHTILKVPFLTLDYRNLQLSHLYACANVIYDKYHGGGDLPLLGNLRLSEMLKKKS
jgi:hypothetical protein